MLEKIGLPPKPSLRGNNWVVDATHCQGCSSQFTFINRKHHCRRCGGIFCGSCTQQRMLLRGQGDSPVRICDPCKTLEEAARFERYGHKSRAAKGGSKLAPKEEDGILKQVLGSEEKDFTTHKTISSASCSNIPEAAHATSGDIAKNLSLDQPTNMLTELGSATPEELREQAILEKQKYRTLKAEGKPEEALRAFKRGKELERQAGALEISLRKNRKRALSSSNLDDAQQRKDVLKGTNLSTQNSKAKDDLSSELKELGWSDMDLHDAEKKPAALSVESELSSLLREVSQKPNKEKGAISNSKSQVIAHKKKALELKRLGNLAEAKEELKKAKILERKIEEEELLGEDDDSDDELSLLIRTMDSDEHDDLSSQHKTDLNINFDHFTGVDDLALNINLEVTDKDMDDPEIVAALESFGWTEDTAHTENFQAAPSKTELLRTEIQSLKGEALTQKRAGNAAEAMALLKKAKVREMELESSDSRSDLIALGSGESQKASVSHSVEEPLKTVENVNTNYTDLKLAPKSKLTIQRELIALKKNALSLRRQGRLDESEEELKKAKVLEQQLEDKNKAPVVREPSTSKKQAAILGDEEEEVTDQDMHDPSYMSLLKNLGWEDEDEVKGPSNAIQVSENTSKLVSSSSNAETNASGTSRKSKSELQRELLALKRKALTLRRQGEAEEADEVLKMASSLEAQLQEFEEPIQREASTINDTENASIMAPQNTKSSPHVDPHEKPEEIVQDIAMPYIHKSCTSTEIITPPNSLQQEILVHKRKAVTLKREGKLAEAKEELRQAKLLEKRMVEDTSQTSTNSSDASASSVEKKEVSPSSVSKPMSSRDRFKLQQESLGHKRLALKLRREGKTAEADAEFELAKALESQLQELDSQDSKAAGSAGDVTVEDFLDPQLLSALQSIGLDDVQTKTPVEQRQELTKSSTHNTDNADVERQQLVERIKAEKIKAVNLKRSGKQAEAMDALRRAKLYEKKLETLAPV